MIPESRLATCSTAALLLAREHAVVGRLRGDVHDGDAGGSRRTSRRNPLQRASWSECSIGATFWQRIEITLIEAQINAGFLYSAIGVR